MEIVLIFITILWTVESWVLPKTVQPYRTVTAILLYHYEKGLIHRDRALLLHTVMQLVLQLVEVEIMSNAAMKLCRVKLIVTRLMFTTKYSCCYNSLRLFCLHACSKIFLTKYFFGVSYLAFPLTLHKNLL